MCPLFTFQWDSQGGGIDRGLPGSHSTRSDGGTPTEPRPEGSGGASGHGMVLTRTAPFRSRLCFAYRAAPVRATTDWPWRSPRFLDKARAADDIVRPGLAGSVTDRCLAASSPVTGCDRRPAEGGAPWRQLVVSRTNDT